MNARKRIVKYLQYLVVLIFAVGIVAALYYGSIPEKYSLKPGDVSPYDITAIRRVVDSQATIQRATQASADTPDVYLFDQNAARESLNRVDVFLESLSDSREDFAEKALSLITPEPTPGDETAPEEIPEEVPGSVDASPFADAFRRDISNSLDLTLSQSVCLTLIEMDEAAYESFARHIEDIASVIMSQNVSENTLTLRVVTEVTKTSDFLIHDIDRNIPADILNVVLKPNMTYDKTATDAARALSYNTVMENPVLIEKGTRIITYGETITPEKYDLLLEMDLINTGDLDFLYLGGVILLMVMIIVFALIYMYKTEKENLNTARDKIAIAAAMLIPFILSFFFVKLSIFAPPVYITALLITAYYGFKSGVLMSVFLTFSVYPLTGFDPRFLFVAISGSFVAALFTIGIAKRNNYALIIISTTLTCFLSTIAMDILTKISLRETLFDSIYAVASSSVSIILALGIMPLFEMIFNSISPLRLIELAQPGNPLLSRLFSEAPGTSQHCVMVGNLAEAAAEAIGANPLVARVGAYYHDIGKLDSPEMFTENQTGSNPHDVMDPEQSVKVITSHPETGLRIARKYRLPPVILKMIYEHHGTSRQAYFYHKALDISKNGEKPEPDPEIYKYKTSRPSFKESAILMLADTVEAAMKSTGINEIDKAEALIRKLVKHKIEEDQLADSDLSFKDIEQIIQSFLHVYSGHFRIRIRYPDDNTDNK